LFMKICIEKGIYWAENIAEYNSYMIKAGWVYDKERNAFATPYPELAEKLLGAESYMIKSGKLHNDYHYQNSFKKTNPLIYQHFSNSGKRAYPYQMAGCDSMIDMVGVLLADQMGLGKTIQAILLCNFIAPLNVLIICPASIKENWKNEWQEWSCFTNEIAIAYGNHLPKTDVVIINFDICARHKKELKKRKWDVLIIDEAHYLKNPTAQRTRAILGGLYRTKPIEAKKVIALTGTPAKNRPIDLYPVIKRLSPYGFGTRRQFAIRYCNGHMGHFGWDESGHSNLEELQNRLRSTIMIRRMKADVLPDLPPKVRQIVYLDATTAGKKLLSAERSIFGKPKTELSEQEYKLVVKKLKGVKAGIAEMSTLRRETAVSKVPAVASHVRDAIDSSGKVILFCHHAAVVEALYKIFKDEAVAISGKTDSKKRQPIADRFQTDPAITLMIANIQAGGVGLNLFASSHVIFAELPWSHFDMEQAEDRAHRIGQKDSVLVQLIVLKDSLDATMARTMLRKQESVEQAINLKKGG